MTVRARVRMPTGVGSTEGTCVRGRSTPAHRWLSERRACGTSVRFACPTSSDHPLEALQRYIGVLVLVSVAGDFIRSPRNKERSLSSPPQTARGNVDER
jgi:hypothetical protein